MNRIIIIGASGHGKVVANIAKLTGYQDIVFLDDDTNVLECEGIPVVGNTSNVPDGDLCIAIGSAKIRQKMMQKYKTRNFPVLIHPNAVIAKNVPIGKGTVIMAGAVINPGAIIGQGCIINTASSVDHDCVIGDYVHISVGAHLAGNVCVDKHTWIGIGAIISNNISICNDCTIGAGCVVVSDIHVPGTYVGLPARRINT